MDDTLLKVLPNWVALKRKISVRAAAELNDLSEDTFRRRYPHLIKQVSPNRGAVELGDAIDVGQVPPKS
jgi:hypothetical protein